MWLISKEHLKNQNLSSADSQHTLNHRGWHIRVCSNSMKQVRYWLKTSIFVETVYSILLSILQIKSKGWIPSQPWGQSECVFTGSVQSSSCRHNRHLRPPKTLTRPRNKLTPSHRLQLCRSVSSVFPPHTRNHNNTSGNNIWCHLIQKDTTFMFIIHNIMREETTRCIRHTVSAFSCVLLNSLTEIKVQHCIQSRRWACRLWIKQKHAGSSR